MFCKNCGSSLDDKAVVCPHCGVATDNARSLSTKNTSNAIAIVGFIFSFLFALVGLICSIVGYNRAKNEGRDHEGLALAGLIISIINIVLGFILALA